MPDESVGAGSGEDTPARAGGGHVCPWWLGYILANPLRRVLHPPDRLLSPHVRAGMTVLEPGPGMGFFTLELARMVGGAGRVVAIDVQPGMLEGLRRRAARAGLLERLDLRLAARRSLGIDDLEGQVDFTLAFAVVHEMPAAGPFFQQVARASKPGARLLFAEPRLHVPLSRFDAEVRAAREAGFTPLEPPALRRGHTVLLEKPRR